MKLLKNLFVFLYKKVKKQAWKKLSTFIFQVRTFILVIFLKNTTKMPTYFFKWEERGLRVFFLFMLGRPKTNQNHLSPWKIPPLVTNYPSPPHQLKGVCQNFPSVIDACSFFGRKSLIFTKITILIKPEYFSIFFIFRDYIFSTENKHIFIPLPSSQKA